MRWNSKYLYFSCAVLALASAACGDSDPGGDLVAPVLDLAGVVTSQEGTPRAGAKVHTAVYRPDCTTPVPVENDTLLIADAKGAFQGWVRGLYGGTMCLRMFASIDTTSGPAQFVQGNFTYTAKSDSVVVHLTIP